MGKALDDYTFALKKHGILTMAGAISAVLSVGETVINMFTNNTLYAGITVTSAATIFAINSFVDILETKREPIALIYDIHKRAGIDYDE